MKKILIFIFFYNFSLAWAVDTYNATNNQLSIPKVNVGINTYTDVVITVGSIVSINGADTGTNDDTYNTANNQLSIPLVSADGVVYKNAVITVEKVIAIGNKLPTITWVQTSNSIPTTLESIGLYRSRNGFGAFDFFGKGYKSFSSQVVASLILLALLLMLDFFFILLTIKTKYSQRRHHFHQTTLLVL